MTTDAARLEMLSALARKVLWLSSWTIHHANHIRPNVDGLKVVGHQASCRSVSCASISRSRISVWMRAISRL